jgi:hypothetical protein
LRDVVTRHGGGFVGEEDETGTGVDVEVVDRHGRVDGDEVVALRKEGKVRKRETGDRERNAQYPCPRS